MTDTDADRIADLEKENERLRRLLDQHGAPGELRHRLRTTLALLRAVMRRSLDTGRDLPTYVDYLEERLDAIARAQTLADQHGEVDLQTLVTDELFQYGASNGENLLLSGPEVRLQPRAGQVFALAVHELAVNAVEHGALGSDSGHVQVCWSVAAAEPDTPLLFVWTESGPASDARSARRGFGTEVLTRMLPYDLEAETQFVNKPDGLRCTIRFPLPKQVGRVAPG